jgi:hypothetical protein
MKPLIILVAFGLLLGGVACGKKNPSTPSPTLTGIAITTGSDMVRINADETWTLTATFSDGSTQTVQGTWSSSTPAIATVDGAGRVRGVASGQTTITADYQSQRATRQLRIVPDYHGRWEGGWTITGCSDSGELAGVCAGFATGDLFGLTLVVNQNRDTMTGTTDFGDDLPGPVSGTIQITGHLVVTGTYTIVVDDLPLEFTIAEWQTTTTDNLIMTGQIRLRIAIPGVQGFVMPEGTLTGVTKRSNVPDGTARLDRSSSTGPGARVIRRR